MANFLYSGSDSEQKALGHFCSKVLMDSFWPYEEFLLSLKIPQTFLIYDAVDSAAERQPPDSVPKAWNGFAMGRVIGGVAELFYIFTNPLARGRGLGPVLLQTFEAHARGSLHAESVMLEVRVSNAAAIRLYEKLGYERIHVRKKYYQDGEDALIYTKALPGLKDGI